MEEGQTLDHPATIEDLQKKCEEYLVQHLPDGVDLNSSAVSKLTQTLLDALCKMDALEDQYDSKTLNILHFNDVYNLRPSVSRPDPDHPYGGFARFCTALKEEQAKMGDNAPLILFSGDFAGPSLTSAITQGTHVLHGMNHVGVHYGTWGNHDFDYGLQKLVDVVEGKVDEGEPPHGKSVTTWIASNMNGADGNPIAGAKKFVVTDRNGIKVGILGSSENWIDSCGKLGEGEASYVEFVDEDNKLCAEMRADGVEVILALTHSRLENDKIFMRAVPEVDLLLGGHDHFNYLNLEERIVKGGQEWQFLNSVRIIVKKTGARPKVHCRQIPIFPGIAEDPEALKIEKLYDDLVQEQMSKVIGVTPVPLESTEEFLRFKESELGNFVADIMQARLGADMGFIQGVHISGKYVLKAGDVKLSDVFSWFPQGTTVLSVRLTGAQVKELFENGVRALPGECHSFVHVSKFVKYVMDESKTPGQRVTDVYFGETQEPIVMEKEYTCAVADGLATARGFGTDFVVDAPRVVKKEFAVPMTDMIIDHFKALNFQPIDTTEPDKHGRIIEIARGEGTELQLSDQNNKRKRTT